MLEKQKSLLPLCLMPMLTNASIYGFDIIAGKNKVTGASDFSHYYKRR